jgi:hypothetical protein
MSPTESATHLNNVPAPRQTLLRDSLFALVFFTVLGVAITWPAPLQWNQAAIGQNDVEQFGWNLWFMERSILSGNWLPTWTDLLFRPTGVSLAYHTLATALGWLSAGIAMLFPWITIAGHMNLHMWLGSALTGLTTFWLARWLTGHSGASLVAGIIVVLSPVRMSRIYYGEPDLANLFLIPVALALVLAMQRYPRRWWLAVMAGGATAAIDYVAHTVVANAGVLLALVGLVGAVKVWRNPAQRRLWLRQWLLFAGTATLVIAPNLWSMVRDRALFTRETSQVASSISNSANLLGFVVPDGLLPAWWLARWPELHFPLNQLYVSFGGNLAEKHTFIGYTVLAILLLLLADQRRRRQKVEGVWWVILGGTFVVALGPTLQAGGLTLLPVMPYRLLNELPLLGVARSPSRFAAVLMLAAAVLVAYWLSRRRRWVVWVVAGLIMLEMWPAGFPHYTLFTAPPPGIHWLADAAQPGDVVLDLPIDTYGSQGSAGKYMVFQTIHGLPLVSGYVSRTPAVARGAEHRPFLGALRERTYGFTDPYTFPPAALATAQDDLAWTGARWVVAHHAAVAESDLLAIEQAVTGVIGEPSFRDNQLTIWEITRQDEE